MAKRRRARQATATTSGDDGIQVSSKGDGSCKRQKTGPDTEAPTRIALSEEQEDRLGRWSSSVQWIIKIAQDRGCNASLAFSAIREFKHQNGLCKVCLQSFDHQVLNIAFYGGWTESVVGLLSQFNQGQLLILSGLGARVPSSGSEVVFSSGKLVAELCDAMSGHSGGVLEIVGGTIARDLQSEDLGVTVAPSNAATPVDRSASEVIVKPDEKAVETLDNPPIAVTEQHSLYQTPNRRSSSHQEEISVTPTNAQHLSRDMTPATPAWLRTPAVETPAPKALTTADADPYRRANPSATPKPLGGITREPRMLGPRLYQPISMLQVNERNVVNCIGLITSDHTIRRALTGSRDWKITVSLIDAHDSKEVNPITISFNLFSPKEEGLPRCKAGSILLLRGVKIRGFNGGPQGNGYPGQFEWAFMDTTEADQRNAMTISPGSVLSPAENKELQAQYLSYRKRHKGSIQAVPKKSKRPLLMLNAVEKEIFFDTTVEIVRKWDGSFPPMIYVTDYTTHPLFYAVNDVYLGAWSREELNRQQENSQDAGNGRVFPISLWDEQQSAIDAVHVGMLVRLENVRPKIQPNGYMEGSISGSGSARDDKLRVIVVKESDTVDDFRQRKEDYLDEVALNRAEACTEDREGVRELPPAVTTTLATTNDRLSEHTEELPFSAQSMPPPGQKTLAEIVNSCASTDSTTSFSKSNDSQHSVKEVVPVLLEEGLASQPVLSIGELLQLSHVQLKRKRVVVCQAQVYDIVPKNIDEFVEVLCGLCKAKLPREHAFCARCAEDDGKGLEYRFCFALLLGEPRTNLSSSSCSNPRRIPLVVRDTEAMLFLPGFRPEDVRKKGATLESLKKRLLPILGSQLTYGSPGIEAQHFQLGIRTWLGGETGRQQIRYGITSSRLGDGMDL